MAVSDRSHSRSGTGVHPWQWGALALGVVLLAVALITSGGSSSSSSPAVATVSGTKITLATYNRWLLASAVSAHSQDSGVPAFVPQPPDYTRCITFEQAAIKKAKSAAQTTAKLKADCQNYRVSLAESVMQFLIGGEWFLGQASREHVTVTAAAVTAATKKSFPKSGGLLHYLNSSGLSRADLQFEARTYLISQKLYLNHVGPTPTITQAQIAAYYTAHKSQVGSDSLAKATPAIKEVLITTAQAPKLETYLNLVEKYWQPRTICAVGYRVPSYCAAG